MAVSEAQFRGAVIAGAVVLVATIGGIRFLGSVGIPPKPLERDPTGTSKELLTKSAETSNVYLELMSKEAGNAGVKAPTLQEMSRALPYRNDSRRHVLEVGQAATPAIGFELRAQRSGDSLVLEIKNTNKALLAYRITTQVVPNTVCNQALPLPIDAISIEGETTTVRTECVWREGLAIAVTNVESIEIDPLNNYLLGRVPPQTLGIDPMIARGHRARKDACSANVSRNVQSEMEKGAVTWRDLVDFYVRHPCTTYQFPADYRALTKDGERAIPAK